MKININVHATAGLVSDTLHTVLLPLYPTRTFTSRFGLIVTTCSTVYFPENSSPGSGRSNPMFSHFQKSKSCSVHDDVTNGYVDIDNSRASVRLYYKKFINIDTDLKELVRD